MVFSEKGRWEPLVEWQIVLIGGAIVLAVVAVVLTLENRSKTRKDLEEVKKYLEESVEKIREVSLKLRERESSADLLIQRQQNELLQHLISLSKSPAGEKKIEDQNVTLKHLLDSKISDQIAQMITQRILDEIKKKW